MGDSIDEELLKAILVGDLKQAQILLSAGADANYTLKDHGNTLLHFTGIPEIANELLRFGANVNARDLYKQTPLCHAVAKGYNLELVRVLLSAGADVNVRMVMGNTPLHVAPNLELTQELLQHGAEVNAVDRFGRAPVHSALIDRKGIKVFKALLSAGADVNMRIGRFDNSLLHYADSLAIIRELLSSGADAKAENIDGLNPIHCAVKHMKEVSVVRELFKHRSRIVTPDDTPLDLALRCHVKNFEVIKELVDYDVAFYCQRFDCSVGKICTVLETAAFHDMACAKLLLKMSILFTFDIYYGTHIELDPVINPNNCKILLDFKEECILEIIHMRVDKTYSKLTLYNLLWEEGDFVRPIYGSFVSIEKEIVTKYPIYHDVILDQLKKCLERGRLLNRLGEMDISLTHTIKGNKIKLNLDCVMMIAGYLSDNEIYNFIIAFES